MLCARGDGGGGGEEGCTSYIRQPGRHTRLLVCLTSLWLVLVIAQGRSVVRRTATPAPWSGFTTCIYKSSLDYLLRPSCPMGLLITSYRVLIDLPISSLSISDRSSTVISVFTLEIIFFFHRLSIDHSVHSGRSSAVLLRAPLPPWWWWWWRGRGVHILYTAAG